MKQISKILLGIITISLIIGLSTQFVFAFPDSQPPEAAPPSDTSVNSATLTGDKQEGTSTQPSIPDTFEVSKYLKLENQASRVPMASTSGGKGPVGVIKLLVDAIDLLIKFIGAVALIVFIVGALLTVVSEGKEDRVEKGKTAMLYAVIGIIIALLSFIIVTFVQSIFF